VAAYNFNEGSGTTVADATGNGNTGAIAGATWTASGKYGAALTFNGSSSWVTINDVTSLHLTNGMTLEAWVKLTTITGWQAVIIKEMPSDLCYALYAGSDQNQPDAALNTRADLNVYATAGLTANTWAHLAATYDGANVGVYINGTLVQTVPDTGNLAASTSPLRIGGDSVWGEYLNGVIDEVRVYNRALSVTEIQTDMNTPINSSPQTGLTAAPGTFTLTSAGATQALTVTATYANGSTQNVTSSATYSSNNTAVTTVSTAGVVTAVANGSATITASFGGFNATASATVNIPPPTQTGLTLAPSSFTLTSTGATQPLTATATYSNGSTQQVTASATYSSNNTAAATVSTSGVVTAVANGSATITASYGGFTASAVVMVNTTVTQTGLTVAPTSFTFTSVRATQPLTVTATFSNGSTQNVTSTATYSSNNTAVATVSGAGVVTAVASGTATITASSGGFNATATATVNTATATGLVAAYSFNEGTGGTVADSSGNGNTGFLSGAIWTTGGRFGGALSFDGSTNWVTVNDASSLDMTAAVTIEAWVNPRALPSWHAVAIKEQTSDLVYGLYANTSQDHANGTINIGGNDVAVDYDAEDTQVPLNNWTHLAVTFDGSILRLYFNGTLVNSVSHVGKMPVSAGPLRIGGDSIWGEYFNGLIDEVRIYNRALSAAEIQADMNTPINPPALTGLTASPANFTLPAVGALQRLTVTATIAGGLTQEATTNTGIAYSSSNPAVATVNAAGLVKAVGNGVATIMATYLGFPTNVTATVAVTSDPTQVGQWTAPFDMGVVAVNLILMRTGKILLYGGPISSGKDARVFDPSSGVITPTPNNATDIFCSGNVAMSDGRILVVGGYDATNNITGTNDVNIFDPATQQWTSAPKMAYRRWYPTATELPDGRILVTSGSNNCWAYRCLSDDPEIYNPTTNTWTTLSTAELPFWYYPFGFLLTDGRFLVGGTSEQPTVTRALNVASQMWTTIDASLPDGASAAMYAPNKIVKSGSSYDAGISSALASNTTYVLDMNSSSPAWQKTAPMAAPRAYHNLTVLPDGSVLATGGELTVDGTNSSNAVYQAELWSPASQTWKTMALEQTPRMYHSTALLMPDGRVLAAGGGSVYPATDYSSGEYFSPPYLFNGARPSITNVPASIRYGTNFAVQTPDAASITSVALIRLGAVTHQFNEEQHFLNLGFLTGSGSLTVQAPANANQAPPGYYMLFILNSNGVPSIAPIIQLH
jgi:uncharacterized protein YjdB